jgi:predicted dienelactone hydrolase
MSPAPRIPTLEIEAIAEEIADCGLRAAQWAPAQETYGDADRGASVQSRAIRNPQSAINFI